ncbi:hypothetical protein IWQ62_006418 [Dispira parvispora]|uniref:Vacuolar ATPase assembly protein VMA22 n=1 Tax=Dispira parvispora TaxID=1520584 RepID=A0A9W8AKC6_9FUNG|nr:hypothetical protein IWQ62_006418 [Dispira parvispora]
MATDAKQLDQLIVEYFNKLEEYEQEVAVLNTLLRQGQWSLSQAKQALGGPHRISRYQYDQRMKAQLRVATNPAGNGNEATYELIRWVEPTESVETSTADEKNETPGMSQLKQRRPQASTSDENSENDSSEEAEIQKDQSSPLSSKSNSHDPLRWFGVLVPGTLRQSQRYFHQSITRIVKLANLKVQLNQLAARINSQRESKVNNL